MNNSTVRFAPWVGPHYQRGFGGLRMLLVCESHYGAKQHERPTVTPEIVKALALGQRHPKATGKLRRHPHFTKIMTAVRNVRQAFTYAQKRSSGAVLPITTSCRSSCPTVAFRLHKALGSGVREHSAKS